VSQQELNKTVRQQKVNRTVSQQEEKAAGSRPHPPTPQNRQKMADKTNHKAPAPSSSSPDPTIANNSSHDLQLQINDLRRQVDANVGGIASNKRAIQRHKLEAEIKGMEGKFRILGYKWKVTNFKSRDPVNPMTPGGTEVPPTTARRKFIKMLVRVAFVNQGLIAESQNTDSLITDCYPAMGAWYDDRALEVVFGDNVLWHVVKEKLLGRPLNIKIRISLPHILHCLYDDILRHRRTLLDADGTRTLYIDLL
jgi:hypothetical protein